MATFSGTKATLFINGKSVASSGYAPSSINYNKMSVSKTSLSDRNGRLTVGAMKLGAPIDGVVDNVQIWGRALSKKEIENTSCNKKSSVDIEKRNLLLQYTFGPDVIPGLDVPDTSGNSLSGHIFSPHHAVAPSHARHIAKWVEDARLAPC